MQGFFLHSQGSGERPVVVVDGRFAEFIFDICQFAFKFGKAWIPSQSQVEHLIGWVEFRQLGQVADAYTPQARDCPARFGGVFPADEFEQRRFPGAVGPDQADLLIVLDFPG